MTAVHLCPDCEQMRELFARGICRRCWGVRRDYGTLDERPPLVRRVLPPALSPQAHGVSYRQLDYWVRVGYLMPSDPTPGSGSNRVWPSKELRVAGLMFRLVAAGLPPVVAHAVARAGGVHEIAPGVRVVVTDPPATTRPASSDRRETK